MTKNGPIPKTKTDSESGECTDHFSTLQNNANLQSPVKNHPNTGVEGSNPRGLKQGCHQRFWIYPIHENTIFTPFLGTKMPFYPLIWAFFLKKTQNIQKLEKSP